MPKSKPQQLNPATLQAALDGLEIQRNKLDEQIGEVRALLGHRATGRPARSDWLRFGRASTTEASEDERRRTEEDRFSSAEKVVRSSGATEWKEIGR